MARRIWLLATISVVVLVSLILTGSLALARPDQSGNAAAAAKPTIATTDVTSGNIRFFPETGHYIAYGFKNFWENNGGLSIFGFPITEEEAENGLTVQYFQRARFEYHPGNPDPFKVELGLLGNEATTLETRVATLEDFANTQKKVINPGLGTVMMEYGQRFADTWWAQKAGNWDMANYQVKEMVEIQEVGEVDRPGRADALKAFESSYLDPLAQAIDAKDEGAFQTAYANAISGCNGCHKAAASSEFPSYKFVKIQIPTAPNRTFIDFAGQQ